ncbi:MAG: hypothetical protein RL650_2251 [Pseudomonadota bacterium]
MTRVRFPSPAPVFNEVVHSLFVIVSADKVLRVLSQDRPCGSVVEHPLGKGEIAGPIPAKGTRFLSNRFNVFFGVEKWQKRNLSGQNRT